MDTRAASGDTPARAPTPPPSDVADVIHEMHQETTEAFAIAAQAQANTTTSPRQELTATVPEALAQMGVAALASRLRILKFRDLARGQEVAETFGVAQDVKIVDNIRVTTRRYPVDPTTKQPDMSSEQIEQHDIGAGLYAARAYRPGEIILSEQATLAAFLARLCSSCAKAFIADETAADEAARSQCLVARCMWNCRTVSYCSVECRISNAWIHALRCPNVPIWAKHYMHTFHAPGGPHSKAKGHESPFTEDPLRDIITVTLPLEALTVGAGKDMTSAEKNTLRAECDRRRDAMRKYGSKVMRRHKKMVHPLVTENATHTDALSQLMTETGLAMQYGVRSIESLMALMCDDPAALRTLDEGADGTPPYTNQAPAFVTRELFEHAKRKVAATAVALRLPLLNTPYGYGMFALLGLVNHSDMPNCAMVPCGARMTLLALRAIAPNEELTYSYIGTRGVMLDTEERKATVAGYLGRECVCVRCLPPDPTSPEAAARADERGDVVNNDLPRPAAALPPEMLQSANVLQRKITITKNVRDQLSGGGGIVDDDTRRRLARCDRDMLNARLEFINTAMHFPPAQNNALVLRTMELTMRTAYFTGNFDAAVQVGHRFLTVLNNLQLDYAESGSTSSAALVRYMRHEIQLLYYVSYGSAVALRNRERLEACKTDAETAAVTLEKLDAELARNTMVSAIMAYGGLAPLMFPYGPDDMRAKFAPLVELAKRYVETEENAERGKKIVRPVIAADAPPEIVPHFEPMPRDPADEAGPAGDVAAAAAPESETRAPGDDGGAAAAHEDDDDDDGASSQFSEEILTPDEAGHDELEKPAACE